MTAVLQQSRRVDDDAEALLERTLAECEEHAARVRDLLRLVDALLAVLPPDRRAEYAKRVSDCQMTGRSPRGIPLNDNIVSIFSEKQELTATEVRDTLVGQGVAIDSKRVANSLDYLTRTGRIARIDRGRYRIIAEGATDALVIEHLLSEAYGPPTYRGHRAGHGLPEDY
jgi:hypothetical protein